MALFETQRRQEKKRNKRTFFYTILLVFVSLVFLAVCVAVYLNVETLNVNGTEKYTPEEILEHVNIAKGDNIFSFDKSEIESAVLTALPYVSSIEIKRDLPTSVDINIVEEKAFYAAEIAGDAYLLSPALKVLERLPDTKSADTELAYLKFRNVKTCVVGEYIEFVDERTFDAMKALYNGFQENYIESKINGINIKSRFDIYIEYDGRFEVYIGDIENIDIKISFLVAIIDELGEDAKGTIDVSNPQEASVALS